jgi:hypothetical protein
VKLRPGPNHIEVQVLDPAGKVSQVSRAIRYEITAQATPTAEQPPQVVVEQPGQLAVYTNSAVPVTGKADKAVAALTVNGTPVTVGSDGRFTTTIDYPAGTHAIRVVGRTAGGAEIIETRTVTVSFTAAVVTVKVQGGDAWLLALVDGAQAPGTGKVFAAGASQTFTGKQVTIRTGNAGATQIVYNGQLVGALGSQGQVVERTFTFQ